MKILVVHNRDISNFPPVKSLIECLLSNSYDVTVITRDKKNILSRYNNLKVLKLHPLEEKASKLKKANIFFENRKLIRTWVKREMQHNDVIWTTTDATVREIGPMLLKYKHVMQLMELIDYLPRYPLIPHQDLFKFNIQDYAKHAWKVVVPERNRAYIQKVWWGLDSTPVVLPNKPYSITVDKNMNAEVRKIIDLMKNDGKIKILYQGVFYKDRKLDDFARAINSANDKYSLYLMGKQNDYSKKIKKEYPHIKCIDFITPPDHLQITKYADIGLLPYLPNKFENNSILNALYCAPNKIYEYSAFGKPMIGTDVLGLVEPFEKYNIGYPLKSLDDQSILNAIKDIEENYSSMSQNAQKFFNDTDLDKIVNSILNS